MLNRDVKKAVILTILSGRTPLVVGERGLGKTTMMKQIAEELGMFYINIDANLLKEGEIGGLPLPQERQLEDGSKFTVTEYAIHTKLKQMYDSLTENSDRPVLIFIDELNRCAKEVMQEMMNMILNREINGFRIPENVYIVAAMNPSQTADGFKGNNSYSVNDMDAAAKDRFVWLYLDSDAREWLDWATSKATDVIEDTDEEVDAIPFLPLNKDGLTFIDESMVEFIASNTHLLNKPAENVDVTPSPRSWEAASDILRTFNMNKKHFKINILDACLKGTVGQEAFVEYAKFVEDNTNPLIKPEELFAGKELSDTIINKFADETSNRKILIAKNMIRFMVERKDASGNPKKMSKGDYERVITIFEQLDNDILVTMMRFVKENFSSLHTSLMKQKPYLQLFMNAQAQVG